MIGNYNYIQNFISRPNHQIEYYCNKNAKNKIPNMMSVLFRTNLTTRNTYTLYLKPPKNGTLYKKFYTFRQYLTKIFYCQYEFNNINKSFLETIQHIIYTDCSEANKFLKISWNQKNLDVMVEVDSTSCRVVAIIITCSWNYRDRLHEF